MERWTQSPCYRQFCEEEFFQHEFPIGPSQMARWRKRIGGAGCERPLTIGTTFIDHGYKSHGAPESSSRVLISGRKLGASLKRAPRRPSAIEPTFGHMKQDGLLGRNFLKGLWRDSLSTPRLVLQLMLDMWIIKYLR